MKKLTGPQKTVATTVGVVAVMATLGFLSAPLYNLFCAVTGFGGVTQEADAGSDTVLDRTVKIRFDASVDRDMPWDFKPMQREMTLKIGETGLAFYEAHNPTDHPIGGSATYNVYPYEAGGYFTKIDCFCFTEQILQPGETVQMPVTFYVDPEIVNDRDAKYVQTITLGYTFYEQDLTAEQQAALETGADKDVN
ncbi:cytochrome c oxidase assembly protein [Pseudooceanicola sp. C21-150M6]|uniref:cytochrome c oxidase assembly protein n=1 Tax=Pseudooceanicola sp. C21-150M6 TaxID=3434355 RepID=UPI003D7F53D1